MNADPGDVQVLDRGDSLPSLLVNTPGRSYDPLEIVNLDGQIVFTIEDVGRWVQVGDALYATRHGSETGWSTDVAIRKYSLTTGSMLWEAPLTSQQQGVELAVVGQQLAWVSDDAVGLVDAETGSFLWTHQFDWTHEYDSCLSATIRMGDDSIHVWCWDTLWRLSQATGEVLTTQTIPDEIWYAEPQLANGRVYVLRTDAVPGYGRGSPLVAAKSIEALDAKTYAVVWSVALDPDEACRHNITQGDVVIACGRTVTRLDVVTGERLWRQEVSGEGLPEPGAMVHWVLDQDALFYAYGPQVLRLDLSSGEQTWQTTVRSQELSTLMRSGQQLLLGARTGFLHLLDARTGQLLWEQDLWATLEPRSISLIPLAVTSEQVAIAAERRLLGLGIGGATYWPVPTPTNWPTGEPTPTATPYPMFTSPAPGQQPPAPENPDEWPGALAAFLNASPASDAQLPALVEAWGESNPHLLVRAWQADLDGALPPEWVVALAEPMMGREGWIAVLRHNQGRFEVAWYDPWGVPDLRSGADSDSAPGSFAVEDLNGDGHGELIYGLTSYGVCDSYSQVTALSWNGQAFVTLDPNRLMGVRNLSDLRVERDTAGQWTIIMAGGDSGCGSMLYLVDPATFTFALQDGVIVLQSRVPVPQRWYHWVLIDANRALMAGDYARAVTLLEQSLVSSDVLGATENERAFAEYQLVLVNVLRGEETQAAQWATTGHFAEQFYTGVKTEFWRVYEQAHNWTLAAEAARTLVRLGGPRQNRLWPDDIGWPVELTLDQICPCPECLQGDLTSWVSWLDP